jgi:hypothetical protein
MTTCVPLFSVDRAVVSAAIRERREGTVEIFIGQEPNRHPCSVFRAKVIRRLSRERDILSSLIAIDLIPRNEFIEKQSKL